MSLEYIFQPEVYSVLGCVSWFLGFLVKIHSLCNWERPTKLAKLRPKRRAGGLQFGEKS